MRTRMKDIAEKLGVSLMTVSKALRGHSDISEATRARVLECANELHYRPNWVARSLVLQRTNMIGLVIPDLMHSFFAEVARGVGRILEPLSYQIVIFNSDENPQTEATQVQLLLERNVDGIILATTQSNGATQSNGTPDVFNLINRYRAPYVLIDRMPAGSTAHFVGVDDSEIGELATMHLIEQGCQRIAHLQGPAAATGVGRLHGYKRALKNAGIEAQPEYIISARHDDVSGYQAMMRLLALRPRPDGVFCYNDPVAAGAMKAVLDSGLDVPADVAIIGAGNVHYSDLLRVPLSTIDQSSGQLGESAARLLLECMQSSEPIKPKRMMIEPRLVVRASSQRR
ncbi:MAG: LacI family DNA-binding transcriptional regulator [Acidobacteriota bacterium]